MSGVQPMPCPVLLGTVKSDGLPALLHKYTIEKKVPKVEKILKKGVDVDSMNNLGQTPLFCASLLGFAKIAEKLLQCGANPNHRCDDLSTPVHAAVFSCNPWLLSLLLDAGGDLRLHDDQGRTPRDWAEAGAQPNSQRMLEFLKRCESKVQSLLQARVARDVKVTSASSKTLLCSLSPLKRLQPRNAGIIPENKLNTIAPVCDMVMLCFGYGKLRVEKPGLSLGLAASVSLISDSDLRQAEDEPLNSFMCGSFIRMTNYSWKGCRVTVKELHDQMLHQHDGHDGLMDLLITEQEYCLQLSHPHLLLLMGVSMSSDLAHTRLVYERVHVGSLFTLLHQKREEFPLLQVLDLLSVVLQVCEVLMYLHGRSLVLRSLSSHTVLIAHPGVSKVTGLGFMVPSNGTCPYAPPPVPLPLSLINWAAPEVIKCKACTGKADIYSLCALIQEIYTDAVPWGCMDPHYIRKEAELGQALITHPAVPQPYYQYLQTGLQHRAQDRTSTLQDLCYMLRCHIREIRSENKRSGQYSQYALQNIRGWTADVSQMRKHDKLVYHETQEHLHHLEGETKDKESHSFSRSVHTEEEESATDTDDLHWAASQRDITHLHAPMSHHASLSEAVCYNISNAEKDLAVSRSISNHISSTVLNLKVSQVLLQQAERSLDNAEAARVEVPCFDEVDVGKSGVVVEENESSGGVGKPLGPPSTNYIPKWTISGDEVSLYSSAEEDNACYPRDLQEERNDLKRVKGTERGQQQTGFQTSKRSYMQLGMSEPKKNSTHRSLKESYQTKPTWTSEISEVVARMTRGRLGIRLGAVGSSDSEDVEDQQLHLQGCHGHSSSCNSSSYQESEAQESSDLEQLFKSFAGIQSESEESTNFYTINRTFDVTNRVLEDTLSRKEEDGSSDLDNSESSVEPSTVFYTPRHHLSTSPTEDEQSQSLSSDEDLDVTVEVCRASTTPAEGKQATENSPDECLPAQDVSKDTEPESITPVQSGLPDLAEIADLSSISHSPTQHQEWVEPTEAPPITRNKGRPPCNSTPRSPRAHRTYLQDVRVGNECLPHLQSLLDTSPWGSPHSQTLCTESYATARAGDSITTNASSASSVLQSPAVRNVSEENTDSPSSANAEFTTASSGARHTTESSQGTSEETERPIGEAGTHPEAADQKKVSENISCPSDDPESTKQHHLNSCTWSLETGEEENNEQGQEAGEGLFDSEHQPVQQAFDEQVCDNQNTSEGKEECEDQTPCQIHDQDLDLNSANVDSNVNSQKSTDKSTDDTERAHSTLDEDLQRILLERDEGLRALRGPGLNSQSRTPFSQFDLKGKGDVGEDYIETAERMNELEAANEGIQNQPYRVREQSPLKIQS